MGGLFGAKKTTASTPPALGAMQVQQSTYGAAINLVYGQTRIPPNLIWYGDFVATAQTSSSGGGGKGGGGGGSTVTGYQYNAAVMLGLCEGVVSAVPVAWASKTEYLDSTGGTAVVSLESHLVSSGLSVVVTVGGYIANLSVTVPGTDPITGDQIFNPMELVNYPPGAGQYSLYGSGGYYFNSAQVGSYVYITYTVSDAANTAGSALAQLGLSMFSGSNPQSTWGYLATAHPTQALGYPDLAFVAGASVLLDSSGALPAFNFEVAALKQFGSGVLDANPKEVVYDLLTDSKHGSGWISSQFGDLTQYSNYCVANGIFISPAYTAQVTAASAITEIVDATNAAIVFSEGVLKIIPYGDQTATAHGVTFTPNNTVQYALTDDDFLGDASADPVICNRTNPADAFNSISIEFRNRTSQYNIELAEAHDAASIANYGLRPMPVISMHMVCDSAVARSIAQIKLQRALYIRNTFSFTLGWKYFLLEPMDIVTLTDSALGLNTLPVRILSIEEDADGKLAVTAEEFPDQVSTTSVAYPVPVVSGAIVDNNVPPGSINAPVIFEPPNVMTAPDLELWMSVSGGASWGGCEVWVAQGSSPTYKMVGQIKSPGRQGLLAGSLANGSDPDTAHSLLVDLSESRGALISGSTTDADNGNTLLWVDGELISYSTATLTSAFHYTLSGYLRRGVQGTPITSHSAGTQVARLDDSIFKYVIPASAVGTVIHIKFVSFNALGLAMESLAKVTDYTYTPVGNAPNPITALTATGGLFLINLAWTFAANVGDLASVEIWGNTSNNLSTGYLLSSINFPTTKWTHPGLTPGQTWYYWIRVIDTSGNLSTFYPTSPTAGTSASPSTDPSAILTQLFDSVTMAQLTPEVAGPIVANQASLAAGGVAALTTLIDDFNLSTRMTWLEAVDNATVTTDPTTGRITLIATAAITTDVEARLTTVETEYSALNSSVTTIDATLTTIGGNLTSAQSAITLLNSEVALSASQVYVANSVADATGTLNVTSAQAYTDLAASEIQGALDVFLSGGELNALTANVAFAQSQLNATSTALESLATSHSALVATVAGYNTATGAAIISEQGARATEDAALATSITSLQAEMEATYGTTAAAATSASEAAVSATDAATSATSATNSANTATSEAGVATTQAGVATTQAGAATTSAAAAASSATSAATQATAAGSSATSASASAVTAASQAGTATTQAGIATTQAGIATTEAGNAASSASAAATSASSASTNATNAGNSATSATNSANTATSEAGTATTQAGISTTQAGIATTQAGIATTEAGNAATSAAAAATSASSASTSATSAGSSATSATNSANTATSAAGTATTQAGIATTQAGLAATDAGNASTSAAAAAASASSATTQASNSASSATSASGSSTSASTSAGTATTQAGIAATQAGIATTQAGNAATSASNAATSAANASTSEGASSTSASNAATSSSAASASASSALSHATDASTYASSASTSAGSASTSASSAASSASAAAVDYSAVTARLDTGDFATVKTQSAASASSVSGLEAQYVLQVGTTVAGVTSMAGMQLASGGGTSDLIFQADKIRFVMPDGSGTPQQVIVVGNVNGVSTVGIEGNLVVDGTIVTRAVADNSITSPASAYTSGSISLPNGSVSNPKEIQTLSIVSTGGVLNLLCSVEIMGGPNTLYSSFVIVDADGTGPNTYTDSGGTARQCTFISSLLSSVTAPYQPITQVLACSYQPASGARTFKLLGYQGTNTYFADCRYLECVEFKK